MSGGIEGLPYALSALAGTSIAVVDKGEAGVRSSSLPGVHQVPGVRSSDVAAPGLADPAD